MKRTKLMKEIARRAKSGGVEWVFVREGANHEVWQYGTLRVTMPRHSDINELTAKGILRDIEEAS